MSGRPYSDIVKANALTLYQDVGPAETSRRLGMTTRTINRWARSAGIVSHDDVQKTEEARAAAAERVAKAWGDMREAEALGAGETAQTVREKLLEFVRAGDAKSARDLAVTYGIMVDKAELTSGRATSRIEAWSETEVDKELREIVERFEEASREG